MANNTWKNYTQKSTALSDNDEVMLLDSTDEKNKRGLMSKFWNYVVDKMATAVISKLETENKTVIGAINYLYGKSSFISKIKNANIQVVNEYVYTGLSFTVPKNTLFIFTAKAFYEKSEPLGISIVNSDSDYSKVTIIENNEKYPAILTYICGKESKDITYYIWAKYKSTGSNKIVIYGLQMK